MRLTDAQAIIIIICIVAGTFLTRGLVFVLFPEKKEPPKVIKYLSQTIPPAMMGLLVVYCLKGVSVVNYPYGLPDIIAIAITAGLHFWKKNVLLSILVGTVAYMLLVQLVFVG